MRILVLTSRYTATRDIIGEDFGRQTRLFSSLGELGHDVDFFVSDYRKHESKNVKLHGINVMIRAFSLFRFFNFVNKLDNALKNKKYDLLIATGEPLWGPVGYWAAKRHKLRLLYDLQDNYETYSTYKIPFFSFIDKQIVRKADIITTVTHALKSKIGGIRKNGVFVIQNGVDMGLFKPADKLKSRKDLKLPRKAKIIVYAGSIHRYEGVDRLIKMFELLKKDLDDVYLAIAGRYVKGEEKYINLRQRNIIYMGSLSQDNVAKLINAGDVAVIPYTNNAQVTYGFPYKLAEYMSCKAPIVATSVGDVNLILKNRRDSLCSPDSIVDMKKKIIRKLGSKKIDYSKELKELTWMALAKKLEKIIIKK